MKVKKVEMRTNHNMRQGGGEHLEILMSKSLTQTVWTQHQLIAVDKSNV